MNEKKINWKTDYKIAATFLYAYLEGKSLEVLAKENNLGRYSVEGALDRLSLNAANSAVELIKSGVLESFPLRKGPLTRNENVFISRVVESHVKESFGERRQGKRWQCPLLVLPQLAVLVRRPVIWLKERIEEGIESVPSSFLGNDPKEIKPKKISTDFLLTQFQSLVLGGCDKILKDDVDSLLLVLVKYIPETSLKSCMMDVLTLIEAVSREE